MADKAMFGLHHDWLGGYRLYLAWRRPDGHTDVMTTITTQTIEEGTSCPPEYGLLLDRTAIQDLLDQIIRAGFLPSDGVGSPAQVEAMKEHIKDLRRMAFDNQRKE